MDEKRLQIGFVRRKWAILIILLCTLYGLFYGIKIGHYKNERIIQDDVISYYAYLPAAFIYHDLKFEFLGDAGENVRIWTHQSPSGTAVLKMPMGVAIMNTPFFLVAHTIARISGSTATGYNTIYEFFILLSAIFYLGWGLILLWKYLMEYFDQLVSTIIVILIFLATNLFYYASVEPGMSHVYSFFLFVALMRTTSLLLEKPNWQRSILTGIIIGLILVVRPSNGLVLLVPLLLYHRRIDRSYLKPILLVFGTMLLVLLPQLLYWKLVTGQWYYYGYGDEGFYLLDPQIGKGLLSFRKGWFVYTPVMLLSVVGFFFLRGKLATYRIPILVFMILNIWVVFSWWCWWYGGSFGSRPLIETYALLALPLGALMQFLYNKSRKLLFILLPVFCFVIFLNFFQIRQYRTTLLHWDSTSKELYWKVFLTNEWPANYEQLLDPPDYDAAKYRRENNVKGP